MHKDRDLPEKGYEDQMNVSKEKYESDLKIKLTALHFTKDVKIYGRY